MGLNDQIGDCVAVGAAHSQRLYRKALTGVDLEWTDAQIRAFYATQNPNGADNGMDIETALRELLHNGGPDGVKIVAYAAVDPTNYDEVRAALHIFGCLLTGFMVQSHNMVEFDRGVPWTWKSSDYNIGGHCTVLGDYGATTVDAFGAITWQEFYLMTDGFWAHQMQELWAPIWPWLLGSARFAANIDLGALASEFSDVTGGGVLPIPSPTPSPTPTPVPVPAPIDTKWWIDLLKSLLLVKGLPKWVKAILTTILQYLGG